MYNVHAHVHAHVMMAIHVTCIHVHVHVRLVTMLLAAGSSASLSSPSTRRSSTRSTPTRRRLRSGGGCAQAAGPCSHPAATAVHGASREGSLALHMRDAKQTLQRPDGERVWRRMGESCTAPARAGVVGGSGRAPGFTPISSFYNTPLLSSDRVREVT